MTCSDENMNCSTERLASRLTQSMEQLLQILLYLPLLAPFLLLFFYALERSPNERDSSD